MRSFSTLLLISSLFLLVTSATAAAATAAAAVFVPPAESPEKPPTFGGWKPIKNVSDPHVQELGRYAVAEHDKKGKANLVFEEVVQGETQVVQGVNYRLILKAKVKTKDHSGGGSAEGEYEATVWERKWDGFRKLTSFKPIKN